MSDMSFKQAKELVERMEFSEIALKRAVDELEKSTQNFDITLKHQEDIINKLPYADKKLSYMTIAVSVNIGLIIGILIGISFFVLNTLVSYFGNVNQWSPLLTAAMPSLFYSIVALAAFSWQALRR